jgi:hypothetical protein
MRVERHDGIIEMHVTYEDFRRIGDRLRADGAKGGGCVEFAVSDPQWEKADKNKIVLPLKKPEGTFRLCLDAEI